MEFSGTGSNEDVDIRISPELAPLDQEFGILFVGQLV